MDNFVFIEACIDSVESALIAQKSGAKRVELCSALFEGGLTPSAGMVRMVKKTAAIDVMAMIRPRGGDFCYSKEEFEVMLSDIQSMKECAVAGVVFGVLEKNGKIDVKRTKMLIDTARPLKVTFHRAFDVTPDPLSALETLIKLGVDRVLTSGQESTVWEGIEVLAKLKAQAGNRIIVMPGGGISERNFDKIHRELALGEYHLGLTAWKESEMKFRRDYVPMGGCLYPPEYEVRTYDGKSLSMLIKGK